MKRVAALAMFGLLLFGAAGCTTTRSISNSGTSDRETDRHRGAFADLSFAYRGELNEFDVLGINRARLVTENEIQRALDQAQPVQLRPGTSILLIQSGAVFPDGAMVAELSNHFRVTAFSGVPPRSHAATDEEPSEKESYSMALRLAAARSGSETILCYWGILESGRRDLETKAISWIPIAGWMLPDEVQRMRIRVKLAVIDVRTGAWRILSLEPPADQALSTKFSRGSSDQKQIELLKKRAYAAAAKAVIGSTLLGVPGYP